VFHGPPTEPAQVELVAVVRDGVAAVVQMTYESVNQIPIIVTLVPSEGVDPFLSEDGPGETADGPFFDDVLEGNGDLVPGGPEEADVRADFDVPDQNVSR
jgi:hypothetical protein